LTICAESPRLAEGAEADVPRKMISNIRSIVHHRIGKRGDG
jgi:hypothetical protein